MVVYGGGSMMESKRFKISEDLMLKLMAIVLALALWIYVQAQQPQLLNEIPTTIEDVAVNWLTDEGYIVTASTDQFADVTVRGTVGIINALQKGDISISVDLAGYEAGQYTVALVPSIPNGLTLYNVNPSNIDIVIDEWVTQKMEPVLDLQNPLADDLVVQRVDVTPASVTVEGIVGDVEKIDRLVLQYDPNSMPTYNENIKPIAVDGDGKQIDSIVVNGFVDFEVYLLKKISLPIEPVFSGELAPGLNYVLGQSFISVLGTEEQLANIAAIQTAELDLTDVVSGDTIEAELLFPDGVSAESAEIKTVTITFE